ncbi:unnamed protein product [Cylicostephanus goldi]|uniref:Uncharacterized protein n=1 Tax=Cylicostephanus goldi TaxID=71465 RepID=A0A3P7M2G5_CYLGO|nr:unnamed protein product [Cylicostephanus goldi]
MSSGARNSYTAEFKLKAVDYAVENGTGQASLHFGSIAGDTKMAKDQEKLRKCDRYKRAFRGSPPKWPALEEELSGCIIEENEEEKLQP